MEHLLKISVLSNMLLCILVFKARHLNRYLSLSIILFVTLWYIVPGVACISVDYLILALSSEVGIETEVFIKSYFIDSCFVFYNFNPFEGFSAWRDA